MFLSVLLLQFCVSEGAHYFSGKRVEYNMYRFIVSIKMKNGLELELNCAGVVIQPSHVIAPGHCFVQIDSKGILKHVDRSRFAVLDRDIKVVKKITDFRKHPNFTYSDGVYEHNIALIILTEGFDMDKLYMSTVAPYLQSFMFSKSGLQAAMNELEYFNSIGTVLGWTTEDQNTDILVSKHISFIGRKKCLKLMCRWTVPWCKMPIGGRVCLRMEDSREDSCSVDAGGIFIRGNAFLGILSWKPTCDYLGPPLLFTNFSEIIEFLSFYEIYLSKGCKVKYVTGDCPLATFLLIGLTSFHALYFCFYWKI